MLHCTVLQWPCNAILYAGPSGQLLYTISLYLVPKGPAQHFLSRPVVKNMGTEWWWLCLYCWRSPAHTRLFPVLRCPSQVDLTGQHQPLTSWIMHYGHTLYSQPYITVLLAVSAAADSGCSELFNSLFGFKCHKLKCNSVNQNGVWRTFTQYHCENSSRKPTDFLLCGSVTTASY